MLCVLVFDLTQGANTKTWRNASARMRPKRGRLIELTILVFYNYGVNTLKKKVFTVVACVFFLAQIEYASAEEEMTDQPLWEIGVGLAGGWLPDYPAAGENSFRGLPFPYIVYRGKFLRLGGRQIVKGQLLRGDWYELDFNADGAFPVRSNDNRARQDMPDLDFLVGIGPELKLKLMERQGRDKLDLKLQVRAVFSTDITSFNRRGFVLHPRLAYQRDNFANWKTQFNVNAGPIFATDRLMKYFYEVEPRFVTPNRPEFNTNGGYLGTEINIGFSKKIHRRVRTFIGTRVGIYTGATNENSPLFRDEVTLGVFGGFVWSMWQSERLAEDSNETYNPLSN